MNNSPRSLVGTLTSRTTKLNGLRVEAWDAAGICTDLIDVAVTDSRGHFTMQLEAEYVSSLLPQRQPAISFRIFDTGKLVPQTEQVVWQVAQQETELTIPIGPAANVATVAIITPASSVVRGTITNSDGSLAANRLVHALDRSIAGTGFDDVPLGQATTAADGEYEIRYFMPAGSKLKADLIVRVDPVATVTTAATARPVAPLVATTPKVTPINLPIANPVAGVTAPPSGGSNPTGVVTPSATVAPAAESPLLPHAPTVAMVDLSLDNSAAALLSEHRTLLAQVISVTSGAKVQLADLAGDQLDYVANVTGLQSDRLQTMVQAAQMSRAAGGAVDAEIFYGLLRSGLAGDLATPPVDVQRSRLESAIEQNLISATYEPQIDNIVSALQNTIVSRTMPATGASVVSSALANSLANRDTQVEFVRRWVGRAGSAQQFWDDLRADSTLGVAPDDLETTLRLDMLFSGFQPALADLRSQRQNKQVTSLRDLARWQDSDWQTFLARVGTPGYVAGDTPTEKASNYAQQLAPAVRAMFPTEFLRGFAAIAPAPVGIRFVPTLAQSNPDLDLTRPLPDAPNWGSIAAADQPAARAEWTAFQREARTFRRTPARTLLDNVVQAGGTNPVRVAANQFLTTSTIDLENTTVDQYLTANPNALDNIDAATRPTVIAYLKGAQRVVRIVGKPEAVEVLMGDGLDSALRITRVSRAEFVDRYADLLGGEAAAHAAYSSAFRTASTAQLALTTTAQSMADVSPWALRGGSTSKFTRPDYGPVLDLLKKTAGATDGTATWPSLFQGEAWCDCEECQSIYGPAAYFVDLLHMLDPDGSDPAPVQHLFQRRPDLPNLLLTCDNTNTPLPYIDMVNEVLELHIAQSLGYTIPGTNPPLPYATSISYDNTGLSADELRAVPQNQIDDVYDKALANEVFPFSLPFRRSLAAMRSYLDQLGTTYYDVLAVFGPADGDAGLTADERLAAETFGLTTHQFKLVAGIPLDNDPPLSLQNFYGYGADDTTWQTELTIVTDLLSRTGISYDDLYALVGDAAQAGTYFLNRAGTVKLDPPQQGQIDGTKIHPDTDTWDRLHRFVRLWGATGWSIADLDRVLFAVGAQSDHSVTIDRATLSRVALVKRASDALEQPLVSVLALWSDLDTWGPDSLYLSLFQNRRVARLDDAEFFKLEGDPATKPADGIGKLLVTGETISNHVATILAALRIPTADLAAIKNHGTETGALSTELNLHNLTVLYRYTVLAKGLGLRIADLVELLRLTGADPFTANDPAPTLAFIDRVGAMHASGCSIATLAYIYRCYSAPGQAPAPSDSVMFDSLGKIWTAIRQVHQDTAVADDPDGTLLASRLALIQPPEIVQALLDALDPGKGFSATARKHTLDDGLSSILGDKLSDAENQVLGTPDPDPNDPVALTSRKLANQAVILTLVSSALYVSLSESAVISVVAATLGLIDSMTRRLLIDWIPGDSGTALDTLLELAGGGLNLQLFDGPGFTNPESSTQIAAKIEMQATAGSTARGAKWSGYLLPLGDGDHTFVLRTDGACSITIGNSNSIAFPAQLDGVHPLVVDNTVSPITLAANHVVRLEVSYDSGTAPGSFALLWKLAKATTAAPIAPEYLFPTLSSLYQDGRGPGFAWKRAHKASLLILGLGVTEDEIAFAESDDHPFGEFHLRDLPMQTPTPDQTHAALGRWQELAAFTTLRASLPVSDTTLVDVLMMQTPTDTPNQLEWWAQNLAGASGWDPDAMQPLFLAASDWNASGAVIVAQLLAGIAGSIPADGSLELGRRLDALQQCLTQIKRIGVAGAATDGARPTLRVWAASEPDSAAAREVVQAVRARYTDDAQWYQIAQTRNDSLRQLQRDALVAHIMPRMKIDDAPVPDVDSLYEYFLIDVEMCACSQTSRVLQGISTVQLFIQRILLGLEAPISASRIDPDKWEWNQEYRVWQANREIFLYPENWIDPELRVDKTPFFADLQSQLSQGPLESTNVEDAFETYLFQLEEVSRLKVCALHWQREGKLADPDSPIANDRSIDTLHVVARTLGAHPTYYYRTLLSVAASSGGTEWTPWQKIDVDIQGDGDTGDVHMLLTTFNRRLYMFWALFTEIAEQSQPGANQGESPAPPLTHWDIRLAWSTYRNGAWSAKAITSKAIRSNRFISKNDDFGYQDAIAAAKKRLDNLASQRTKAEDECSSAEDHLWVELEHLRSILILALTATLDHLFPGWETIFGDTFIYNYLSPLFDHTPADLVSLEKWISDKNKTFTSFLDDIYKAIKQGQQFDSSIADPASKENDLLDEYDSIDALRKVRDDARDAYANGLEAWKAFKDGKSPLAITSFTTRSDHTFWLSSADQVTIHVLRHDDATNPRELGTFILSGDGRSISASSDSKRYDLSRQTPRHSSPNINSYEINTSKKKGLDLEGIPNLLGRVHNADFYNEHWWGYPVTSDSPRPFFLSKGDDLEAALPYVDQSAKPPKSEPSGKNDVSSGDLTFGIQQQTIAQKSFGLDGITTKIGQQVTTNWLYCFEPFQHPFIHSLIKRLERDGVDGLLTTSAQNPAGSDSGGFNNHFDTVFNPSAALVSYPYPPYDVDFRAQGAYSLYNWELFFHAPYVIAARLMQDARYDDARRWLHYIFDPTTSSKEDLPTRFWKLQPFRDNTDTLNASQLMTALATGQPADVAKSVTAQVDQWNRYPADPHRIAQLRLSAYQKAIVFKYLDNLIAWADSLFTQDTIETINQATQLYIFPNHLLRPRPQQVPQKSPPPTFTYGQLRGHLDEMSDMVTEVESMLHPAIGAKMLAAPDSIAYSFLGISHLPVFWPNGATPDVESAPLAFCVPANTKLLDYFNTIDDRLFKIRHCMNIEGVVQQLPLFQPPIDPALLVRAAAMGLDIGSILSDLSAPLPFHRFSVILGRARDLCGELQSLGGSLLAALEKCDAETLALLRATHDLSLLKAVLEAKKQQVKEAEINKLALQRTRDVTQTRLDYYASRDYNNAAEAAQVGAMITSIALSGVSSLILFDAGGASLTLDLDVGPTGMGAHATAKYGGSNIGAAGKAFGEATGVLAKASETTANIIGLFGGWDRRQDEWNFQKDLATRELAQIDQQIAAADIRIAMANLDVTNQQLQIDNAQQIEDTLRSKYTNAELYSWMVTQISTTYYQAYRLAYDLAKRAERCYRYELGIPSSSFIQFGYWDSLRKGLLAGEQLALDLKRMDASYLQTNRREYEITRHISLVLQDPQAFIDLRRQGWCELDLPEELFDADYPGHYFRRLKSVSLTLPCVVGPYTPINCTLTLLSSQVRINANAGTKYPEENAPNDARFSHSYGAIQSVATSHGQNDAGLFEVNFHDERYLPFEGAGAISRWRIELPADCNAFDFDTLSDVIIKLSYTARDGGKPLADAARKSLRSRWTAIDQQDGVTPMTPLRRLFRVRYEFSDAWGQFRNALAAGDASMTLTIDQTRFLYLFRGAPITIIGAQFFATLSDGSKQSPLTLTITPPGGEAKDLELVPPVPAGATMLASAPLDLASSVDPAHDTDWTLAAKGGFPIATVRDLFVVITYTVKMPA